jgi:phosphoenolpyruvate carboxylase
VSLLPEVCEKVKKVRNAERDYGFSQKKYLQIDEKNNRLMFRFIQYIERQIVLFDAVEDAFQ